MNSTGAKAIYYNGSAISTNVIATNGVYLFIYDGTNWVMLNPITLSDAIADGETGLAPTQNAVYDALILKADKIYVDGLLTKQDTNDGKTYKAVPSFTDGVLSWTAEEVV